MRTQGEMYCWVKFCYNSELLNYYIVISLRNTTPVPEGVFQLSKEGLSSVSMVPVWSQISPNQI